MATYSHSRISTFENCPYQYKLKYIDKIKVDVPTTIEAFMGDLVHQTLEKLYKDKKFMKDNSKEELIKFYKDLWEKEYSDDILIAKADQGLTSENYRKMGLKFIEDYYDKYKPFDQLTILGLETQDRMTLPDGNQWHVRIDKLACDDENNYYVCDYKTNARMKDQEEADADRQLALYSIWVKDKFKDCKSVKLIWHMLAFNKDAISERTDEQLKKLQQEVVDRIKEIESATEFPRKQTALCNYCGFKSECPSFKHEAELEKIEDVKKFKEDEGVQLVDEFSEVKTKLSEFKKAEEEFKEKLIAYTKQFDIDVVYGSNKKCSVKEFEKVVMPEDKEGFIKLLKDKGLWEECSMVCYPKLNSKVVNKDIEKEIIDAVNLEKDFRLSLSKRKDIEEE
ncbi:MAG: PD-(D/E)XK nuclease family protein [Candidatus Heimdallarchaeota archaeon]|nr:PD-(D/E)XK nuclease family protein [Candidatus Heimdallarchaeota archaeon]